jgi:hypothetical protein
MSSHRWWLVFGGAALVAGCGAPKEAEDPKSIIGEDLTHEGVYGGATGQDSPRDLELEQEGSAPKSQPSDRSAADKEKAARTPNQRSGHSDATEPECRAAASHLIDVGLDLAITEERDLEKKKRLLAEKRAAKNSSQVRAHIAEWTRECLARGTTRAEAQCIARIRNETDISRCVGE